MQIKVSGEPIEIEDDFSIKQVLQMKNAPDNIVVVLNGDIIDAEDWEITKLQSNDEMELIRFVAGG